MPTPGKLEAMITVPAGGWDMTLTDVSSGPTTVTLPAGTYYHSSPGSLSEGFADALATVADAAMTADWSFSVNAAEGNNGNGLISAAGGTCTVTFDDVEIRDLLGFTGNLSGSPNYQSTDQVQGLWIASYGWQKKNGGVLGEVLVSDRQEVINSNGNVFAVQGQSYEQTSIAWPMETRIKTWTEHETRTNESFQSFLKQGIWGEASWADGSGVLRFYPDAGDDATFGTYSAMGMATWAPEPVVQHFAGGRWGIFLPTLIVVPS